MPSSTKNPGSKSGTLFVVSAPSGAGKTSLLKGVRARDDSLVQAVTTTTRPMREGEVNGRDYHFVTPEVFKAGVEAGEFLEHANVFGNMYGLTYDAVHHPLAQAQDVLVILDVQGAETLMRAMPENVVSIFILPPSFSEMRKRLTGRGQNDDTDTEKRIKEAQHEVAVCSMFDYLLVNDDFENAVQDIQALIRYYRIREKRMDVLENLVRPFFLG